MFQSVNVKELQDNPFSLIGDKWMLITAGDAEKCNTMTASWGGVGVMWGAPAATCYIRPQRYTREFADSSDTVTLSFFPEEYRQDIKTALNMCL